MLFVSCVIKLCKSLIMIEILQQILLKDTKQAIDILVLFKHYRVSNTFSDVPVAKYICKPQLQEDVDVLM